MSTLHSIPRALPESAFDPVGNIFPTEVRPSTGLMADGRPWPEEAGEKWPWIYDVTMDYFRLATQKDLDQLQAIAETYAFLVNHTAETRAMLRSKLADIAAAEATSPKEPT